MGATYEKPRNSSCAVALGGTPGESTNTFIGLCDKYPTSITKRYAPAVKVFQVTHLTTETTHVIFDAVIQVMSLVHTTVTVFTFLDGIKGTRKTQGSKQSIGVVQTEASCVSLPTVTTIQKGIFKEKG